jgi:hypothetical protein
VFDWDGAMGNIWIRPFSRSAQYAKYAENQPSMQLPWYRIVVWMQSESHMVERWVTLLLTSIDFNFLLSKKYPPVCLFFAFYEVMDELKKLNGFASV